MFGNRPYLMLVFAGLFSAVAGGYMDVVGLYMSTYFWGFSAQEIAFLGLAAIPAFLLAVGLARPISERFDKKKTALGLATFAVLFGALPVLLRLVGLMPPNGHPAAPVPDLRARPPAHHGHHHHRDRHRFDDCRHHGPG